MNEELLKRIENIERKINEIYEILKLSKINKLKSEKKEKILDINDDSDKDLINEIYEYYKKKINKRSRLIPKARQKIKARLSEYDLETLKKAIDNFYLDHWWMENNAHRGVAWFFHSEERIEQFINLVPKKKQSLMQLYFDGQICRYFDNKLKIFANWSGTWLLWNKDHPQYEKFVLKQGNEIISKGKDAYNQYYKYNLDNERI